MLPRMVRPTHGSEHVHRHPEDRQRTISELLAAGTNSDTKIPVALMESVYEGPAKPEPKRKLTKKQLRKRKKRRNKKVSKYALGSDSESDREFLDGGHGENSSGESSTQSADEADVFEEMYGQQNQFILNKREEEERKRRALEQEKKNRNIGGDSVIAFEVGQSEYEAPKKAKYKKPTDKDLKNNYEETQLSFGFGSGVDIDAYIEKEDRDADNDQPKAGAKDTTEISFGGIDRNAALAKKENYWATKRERKSREKAFKRRLRDKEIIRKQRERTKRRREQNQEATRKLHRMKRATSEWIQNQLESEAAIMEGRTREEVLFEVTVYQSINRHPSFIGYSQRRDVHDVSKVSPMFWGYSVKKNDNAENARDASIAWINTTIIHPGSYFDNDKQKELDDKRREAEQNEGIEETPVATDVHPAATYHYKRYLESREKSRKKKKRRKRRQTGAQMKAAYERKQKEAEEKRLRELNAEKEENERICRENWEELQNNAKHVSFYGMFRDHDIHRDRAPVALETPAFLGYVRETRDEGESDEEEEIQEFDVTKLEPFGSRCLICLARPGVRGYPGCPACFDHHEKLPHTFPQRKPDDVYEPIFVRPQGIVSLEDLKGKTSAKKKVKKKKKKKKKKAAPVKLSKEEQKKLDNKLSSKRYFRVGAYVEAKVRGWDDFYLGKITSKHKDGMFYSIEFENGELHDDISCRRIRKLKRQRVRTSEKYTSSKIILRPKGLGHTPELPESEKLKKKEKFSLDGEMAKQAHKKAAWLSKMHTRMVDRSSIIAHRETEGYNPISIWIKSIPSGHVVKLVCNNTETVDELIRLFQANSGEYGPEALGYFFLPTESGCFFLDNTLNFATDLRNDYLPGDRTLADYGIGAIDAGNQVSILKVSAAGGISDPNPRCIPSVVLKYFNQNFSVVLGKELKTDLIIRIMEQAPKALPALDWVQHSIIRVVQDQLRQKENIRLHEKMKEVKRLRDLKRVLRQKHHERMLQNKRDKYRKEKELLKAKLAIIEAKFVQTGDVLEDGAKKAEVKRVKTRIKRLEQKEYKLERSLSHRNRRDEDQVPMYVFRKFVVPEVEHEDDEYHRRSRLGRWDSFKAKALAPFILFDKKLPLASKVIKNIGKKLFVQPAAKAAAAANKIRKKITPKFVLDFKENLKQKFLEWKKRKKGITDGEDSDGEEEEFDEKDFLNMTKAQRSQVRAKVKKRLKQNREKIAAKKRALKDAKHENEIKMKYRTYRHQYHVPYQQVKPLAIVADRWE